MNINIYLHFFFVLIIFYTLYRIFKISDGSNEKFQSIETIHGSNENFKPTKTIPRNIFQTWKTTDLPETCKPFQHSLISKNQSFSYYVYDDVMVEKFMKSLPWYGFYKKLLYRIQQIDFFRYCLLYVHGGVYFDIDVECVQSLEPDWNSFPLDKITVGEEYKWSYDNFQFIYPEFESITGTTFQKHTSIPFIGNYAFICPRKSKAMKGFIQFIISKYKERSEYLKNRLPMDKFIFYTTGPYILTEYYYQQQNDFLVLPRSQENNLFQFGKYGLHHSRQSWLQPISQ